MYIEFSLPTGAAGMAAGMTKQSILRLVRELGEQHGFKYTTITRGYKLYIELGRDRDYSLLSLVWDSKGNPRRTYTVREGTMPPPVYIAAQKIAAQK